MLNEGITEPSDVAGTIAAAVDLALARDFAAAGATIATIDPEVCRAERSRAQSAVNDAVRARRNSKKSPPDVPVTDGNDSPAGSRSENRWERAERYHLRDGYRCRYAHCNRRTVDTRVVEALSNLIPDALPFRSDWANEFAHPLVWTDTASLDHVVPISRGGPDTDENFICSCACCNYAKSNVPIEVLGWTLLPVPEDGAARWDGLVSRLPKLEALVADLSAKGELPESAVPRAARSTRRGDPIDPVALREGNFVWFVRPDIGTAYSYRVVAVDQEHIRAVMMWRDKPSQCWVEGKTYDVELAAVEEFRLLRSDGPWAGDPV